MMGETADGFTCFIEARVNDILKDGIGNNIPKSYVHGIQIGIECGYDKGIKMVGKGTDVSRLYQCVELLEKKGLLDRTFFSFIIGFPWEGEEEIFMTLRTIEDLCAKYNITASLNWLIFLPSRLWQKKEAYGIYVDENLYDKVGWICDRAYFDRVHPKIDDKLFRKVEREIIGLQMKDYNIAHPLPDMNIRKFSPELLKNL